MGGPRCVSSYKRNLEGPGGGLGGKGLGLKVGKKGPEKDHRPLTWRRIRRRERKNKHKDRGNSRHRK